MTNKELLKQIMALKTIHEKFPRMSAQQILIFYIVAAHEKLDQATLTRMSGIQKTTVSRHIRMFSDLTAEKTKGASFVSIARDPMNLNTNIITLTDEGKEFIKSL